MRRHLSLLVALVAVVGCSDDDTKDEIVDNLSFTRENGTQMTVGSGHAVCCSAWEPGFHDDLTFKTFVGDASGGWKLFVLADSITVDSTYAFPTGNWSGGSWTGPPLALFFVDAQDGNELSGAEFSSTGTVTVTAFDCGPPARIAFTIDARVASEVGGPWVEVSGTFSAIVRTAPPGCDFSL